jgi:DTW domain-containing protein YfiP
MVGEKPEDFLSLSEQCETQQSMAVFYPSPTSADFELATNPQPIETLLFLDGTWRKALKLWLLNPWLWAIPTYRINPLKPSNYDIRKTKQPNSLSTLEAVSYGLKLNETVDTAPLLALQSAMQRHWGSSHLRSKPTPLAPTAAAKK